jgi:hypothetical protein
MISPACRDGIHEPCGEWVFDPITEEGLQCECDCHNPPRNKEEKKPKDEELEI